MSGEVQPRRRRDKKKKKAQLEALVKEEWEEGTALYGAEHEAEHEEEEEVVETVRDSSSGEEEESPEEFTNKRSMTYKIVFFILLLLLGAVASLVLVDSPSEHDGLETSTRVPVSESSIGSNYVPETNEEWEAEGRKEVEEDGDGTYAPEGIGYGDATSFLESISGFLNDYLEAEPTPDIHQAEADEKPSSPNESESPPNYFGEVEEEEFEEITEETEGTEVEKEHSIAAGLVDKMSPTPVPEPPEATQMEHPVDVDLSQPSQSQWQSTYPGGQARSLEPIRPSDNDGESYSYNHIRETQPQESQSSNENSSPSADLPYPQSKESEDNFDFTQRNEKPDGSVQEDEILVDGIL